MPAQLPVLDAATPMTAEEKKERQRLHVRRSYYRKLNRMDEMREQVRALKEQYLNAIRQREALASSPDAAKQQQRAVALYAQISRAKEQLLEENAALQQMVADQHVLTHKMSQLLLEFQNEQDHTEAALFDALLKNPYDLRVPMTVEECQQLAWSTYMDVLRFMQSNSFLTTGAIAFGWRDRRCLEGDRLKFSLKKRFTHISPFHLARRSWDVLSSAEQHGTLYSASLKLNIYTPQVVDDNNVVIFRVFSLPDGTVVAKSLYLVSRFQVETGYVIIFRSIAKERLRKKYQDEFEDPKTHEELMQHWIGQVFTWITFEESGDDCILDFGGDIPGSETAGSDIWMLEVLLIALRWEAKVNGPIFSITGTC
uniref:START domain-containing protein n=1 Tax=Globisporangium ultimum (strain ATCC 200006 / CBS 805.95 / DAOM BR144) TaxID=431595 RepID=K3WXZ1_GLOUD